MMSDKQTTGGSTQLSIMEKHGDNVLNKLCRCIQRLKNNGLCGNSDQERLGYCFEEHLRGGRVIGLKNIEQYGAPDQERLDYWFEEHLRGGSATGLKNTERRGVSDHKRLGYWFAGRVTRHPSTRRSRL